MNTRKRKLFNKLSQDIPCQELSARVAGCLENACIKSWIHLYKFEAENNLPIFWSVNPGEGIFKIKKLGEKGVEEIRVLLQKEEMPDLSKALQITLWIHLYQCEVE